MGIEQRIKFLRKQKGLSQKELAFKVGVTPQSVYFWERGTYEPNPIQREKLCEIFGIKTLEIFGGVNKEEAKKLASIKITGKVKATGKVITETLPEYNVACPCPDSLTVGEIEGVIVCGESMFPIAAEGDVIFFNKTSKVLNGDLVYIGLKENGSYFKRYFDTNPKNYTNWTKEAKKNIINNDKHVIMLKSINKITENTPILCVESEIDFCYKVVGIFFK